MNAESTLEQQTDAENHILQKGAELGQRYTIDELIGSGGMAAVYSAYDQKLKARVAIKVLDRQYASRREFVKRFYREAQAAAQLSHPGITRVFDVSEFESKHCIIMELIEGRSLEKVIAEKKRSLLMRR